MSNLGQVYAKDLKPGVIYKSTACGEFQVDAKTGKIFHLRLDGTVSEIKPHPHSLFYIYKILD